MSRATDSPRWCAKCDKYGDHHTDRHHEALYDPESMWWAVSDGDDCYSNGLTESEARALASKLNATDITTRS